MVESNEDEGKKLLAEIKKFHDSVLKNRSSIKNRRGRPPSKIRTSIDPEELDEDISPPSEEEEVGASEKSDSVGPPESMEDWETMSPTTSMTDDDSSYVTSPGPETPPMTPETEYTTESSLSHYISSETDPNEKTEDDPNATTEYESSPSSEPSEDSEDEKYPDDCFIPEFPIDPNNPIEVPFAKGAWPPQWGPKNALRNKVILSKFTKEPQSVEQASTKNMELTCDDYKHLILSTAPFFGTSVMKKAFYQYSSV